LDACPLSPLHSIFHTPSLLSDTLRTFATAEVPPYVFKSIGGRGIYFVPRETGGVMILNQGKLAGGLVDELLEVISKYEETLYTSTVIGALELVKQQVINDSLEDLDEDL
jgi:hypothetical protein